MNISTLNQFVEKIKQISQGQVDISTWRMFMYDRIEYGQSSTVLSFIRISHDETIVLKVVFIGETILEDSMSISSFNSIGYKDEYEYIKDIAENSGVAFVLVKRLYNDNK